MNKIQSSICYRNNEDVWPTFNDYEETIELLKLAQSQLKPDGNNCMVCGDSGHQSFECHHNPLLLAKKFAKAQGIWQCWHCGYQATNKKDAELHFGKNENDLALCLKPFDDSSIKTFKEHMQTLPLMPKEAAMEKEIKELRDYIKHKHLIVEQLTKNLQSWRECFSTIIHSLASIVNVHTSDKLFNQEAIPREPVMIEVSRIRNAVDKYGKLFYKKTQ